MGRPVSAMLTLSVEPFFASASSRAESEAPDRRLAGERAGAVRIGVRDDHLAARVPSSRSTPETAPPDASPDPRDARAGDDRRALGPALSAKRREIVPMPPSTIIQGLRRRRGGGTSCG